MLWYKFLLIVALRVEFLKINSNLYPCSEECLRAIHFDYDFLKAPLHVTELSLHPDQPFFLV